MHEGNSRETQPASRIDGVRGDRAVGRRSRRIELVQGLPPRDLLQRIQHHLRGGDAERRAAAFYLVDFDRREEYKRYSYTSCIPFGEAVLGRSRKEVGELLRVGKALEELPAIDRAFGDGSLGWSKLREITRVAT